MAKAHWRPLGGVDLSALRDARLTAHYAVQWLARAARSYGLAQPGDAHSNLGWDDVRDGFATQALKPGLQLSLRIPTLMLGIGDATLSLDGRTDADALGWLGEQLHERGFDADRLEATSPWEMPRHAIGNGAAYRADGAALRELAAWFVNANVTLDAVRARYAAQASPVRCWPHHFDIATLISLDTAGGEHARSTGAGLSPGDEHYGEPYFYVSPWPYPEPDKLPKLTPLGHWHTQHFTAAVTTATKILAAKDRQTETEAFVDGAVAASVKALG